MNQPTITQDAAQDAVPPFRVRADAAAKLAVLRAVLADLDLTADAAHALLLADECVNRLCEEARTEGSADLEEELRAWQEDGHEAWADVLCFLPDFVEPA